MPTSIPMPLRCRGAVPLPVRDHRPSARVKIHHAAFDAHLIGVDPDYRIHVSDRLLEIHDGPFLELGLKGIAGTLIDRPRRLEDRPDRDRLALRFEEFRRSA
jgi:putative restriction endonuclease